MIPESVASSTKGENPCCDRGVSCASSLGFLLSGFTFKSKNCFILVRLCLSLEPFNESDDWKLKQLLGFLQTSVLTCSGYGCQLFSGLRCSLLTLQVIKWNLDVSSRSYVCIWTCSNTRPFWISWRMWRNACSSFARHLLHLPLNVLLNVHPAAFGAMWSLLGKPVWLL